MLSNIVDFEYSESVPSWGYDVLATGNFVAVEYCFGYLFTAEYYGDDGVNGLIKQWQVKDDYTVTLVKSIGRWLH